MPNRNMSNFVAEDLAQNANVGLGKFPIQSDRAGLGCATAEAAAETVAEGNLNHGWKIQNGPRGSPLSDPPANIRNQNRFTTRCFHRFRHFGVQHRATLYAQEA